VKQVARFLGEPDVKSRVLDRVHAQVDAHTCAFIGHSLGSVVAYEYLCRHPATESAVLITLGSPLGIRTVIFDKLTPPPTDAGAGVWPGATRWTNIADRDDIVALRKDLAPLFPPPEGVPAIVDLLVDNGGKPHSAERYLTTPEAGAAVAAGL
jgi:pimeloyl-ACP methyl ester carboxylesterase